MKTLVWGFTYDRAAIVDHLKEDGACDVKIWISTEKRATYSRREFMMPDLSFKFESPVRCPAYLYDRIYSNFYDLIETIYHRKDAYYQHTVHDYLDYYHQLLDYFYYLLTENKIELVLFESLPHYGSDRILYELAKAMGIKTINLYYSTFNNRFFYVYDIHDCGYFRDAVTMNPYEKYSVDHKFNLYMDYIQNYKPYNYSLLNACSDFFKNKERYAFQKYGKFRQYKKNHDRMVNPDVDYEKPYVYFPLHFQPELTTFPLAGKFVDQALALETLSELIPDDWKIYIKESVMQGDYRRGNGFFSRIKKLKKVQIVPMNLNSHKLIKHAQFTATLTGTAGFESVVFGKAALVFGQPWYMTFPGIFEYDPANPDIIKDVLAFQHDKTALEESASQLMAKCAKGEICYWYSVPDFDKVQNAKVVATSLAQIIANHPANRSKESVSTQASPILA